MLRNDLLKIHIITQNNLQYKAIQKPWEVLQQICSHCISKQSLLKLWIQTVNVKITRFGVSVLLTEILRYTLANIVSTFNTNVKSA